MGSFIINTRNSGISTFAPFVSSLSSTTDDKVKDDDLNRKMNSLGNCVSKSHDYVFVYGEVTRKAGYRHINADLKYSDFTYKLHEKLNDKGYNTRYILLDRTNQTLYLYKPDQIVRAKSPSITTYVNKYNAASAINIVKLTNVKDATIIKGIIDLLVPYDRQTVTAFKVELHKQVVELQNANKAEEDVKTVWAELGDELRTTRLKASKISETLAEKVQRYTGVTVTESERDIPWGKTLVVGTPGHTNDSQVRTNIDYDLLKLLI